MNDKPRPLNFELPTMMRVEYQMQVNLLSGESYTKEWCEEIPNPITAKILASRKK